MKCFISEKYAEETFTDIFFIHPLPNKCHCYYSAMPFPDEVWQMPKEVIQYLLYDLKLLISGLPVETGTFDRFYYILNEM